MWTTDNNSYFHLSQRTDEIYQIQIQHFDKHKNPNAAGYVLELDKNSNSLFLSFYEKPIPIIVNELKELIETLCPEAINKPAALANMKSNWVSPYWMMNLVRFKGEIWKDSLKINAPSPLLFLFTIRTGIIDRVIVHRDVAETMLRAGFCDFKLTKANILLQ